MVAISQARGLFTGAPPPTSSTSTGRRVFRATQSLPSFPSRAADAPIFFSGNREAYESVIQRNVEYRLDSSVWGAGASSRPLGSGAFAEGSFNARSITEETQADAGDGFDMDDVFPDSGVNFASLPHADVSSHEPQESSEAFSAILARLTDTHINSDFLADQGDADMDTNEDAEGEGEDSVAFALNAPAGRPIAGRRGFSKSQSLPASVFSNDNF